MQPLTRLGLTGVVAALGLTACGADPKPEATTPGAPTTPAPATALAPATEVSRIGALPASDAAGAPASAKSTPAWAGAVGGGAPPTPNVGAAPTPERIEVAVGASFEVHMDSNPTTGYMWRVREPLDAHLSAGPKRYEGAPTAAPGQPQIVGAGGVEFFSFTGVTAGEATLVLEYARSWEKGPAETVRTWLVTVK
jgi:predicted secreted protein